MTKRRSRWNMHKSGKPLLLTTMISGKPLLLTTMISGKPLLLTTMISGKPLNIQVSVRYPIHFTQ